MQHIQHPPTPPAMSVASTSESEMLSARNSARFSATTRYSGLVGQQSTISCGSTAGTSMLPLAPSYKRPLHPRRTRTNSSFHAANRLPVQAPPPSFDRPESYSGDCSSPVSHQLHYRWLSSSHGSVTSEGRSSLEATKRMSRSSISTSREMGGRSRKAREDLGRSGPTWQSRDSRYGIPSARNRGLRTKQAGTMEASR